MKGQFAQVHGCPLIFQNFFLPELAPSTGQSQKIAHMGLPRLHRAGPSASLDKSADQGYLVVSKHNTIGSKGRQLRSCMREVFYNGPFLS